MAETLFLKPAAGRFVRDPVSRRPLAAEGEVKPASLYWRRRLMSGDVIEARPAKAAKPGKEA